MVRWRFCCIKLLLFKAGPECTGILMNRTVAFYWNVPTSLYNNNVMLLVQCLSLFVNVAVNSKVLLLQTDVCIRSHFKLAADLGQQIWAGTMACRPPTFFFIHFLLFNDEIRTATRYTFTPAQIYIASKKIYRLHRHNKQLLIILRTVHKIMDD